MKSRRPFSISLLIILVLAACSQPLTVEQQVIATIRQMEEKIEAGQRLAFMEHVDEAFTGQDGQMNRDQVRALVIFQLNRHKQLQAQLFPISVSETGPDTATAKFRALVTGGRAMVAIATGGMEIGALTVMTIGFREREVLLHLFEDLTGVGFFSFVYPWRNWTFALSHHQSARFETLTETQGLFTLEEL